VGRRSALHLDWNPIYVVHLGLCAVICTLGIIGWRRSGKAFPVYIGMAFALFGVSHLASILGLMESLEAALIGVRTLAYVLVAFGLYRLAIRAK
jgi:hypothetical protein